MKTAVFIVNYNMPERADALYEYLDGHCKNKDIYLIDNGTDLVEKAKHSNVFIPKNVQTTQGWLAGMQEADKVGGYFAYMFLITSTRFIEESKDPIASMMRKLEEDENAVGVHASLTPTSTTSWEHLKTCGSGFRRTWFIDNICSLYRASWFDLQGRFDKEMIYAHGVDLEMCYKARAQGKSLWVDDDIQVEKITDIAYKMDRMRMTANDRNKLARQNMEEVMKKKYGSEWFNIMMKEGVQDEWK